MRFLVQLGDWDNIIYPSISTVAIGFKTVPIDSGQIVYSDEIVYLSIQIISCIQLRIMYPARMRYCTCSLMNLNDPTITSDGDIFHLRLDRI
uniref:Uncharacterized protein n=1 Tax=Picea glauca TaxID=3330 RepID=A0A101M5D7_PICGL|nr:hypothetical protein ABT39_MTgene1145 [Picea glauca]QHR91101.1 hypothetical protein Q903MT_gene5133 [Picea sitchensis]